MLGRCQHPVAPPWPLLHSTLHPESHGDRIVCIEEPTGQYQARSNVTHMRLLILSDVQTYISHYSYPQMQLRISTISLKDMRCSNFAMSIVAVNKGVVYRLCIFSHLSHGYHFPLYPRNFFKFPPICSKSNKKVSCPNKLLSSPSST